MKKDLEFIAWYHDNTKSPNGPIFRLNMAVYQIPWEDSIILK